MFWSRVGAFILVMDYGYLESSKPSAPILYVPYELHMFAVSLTI